MGNTGAHAMIFAPALVTLARKVRNERHPSPHESDPRFPVADWCGERHRVRDNRVDHRAGGRRESERSDSAARTQYLRRDRRRRHSLVGGVEKRPWIQRGRCGSRQRRQRCLFYNFADTAAPGRQSRRISCEQLPRTVPTDLGQNSVDGRGHWHQVRRIDLPVDHDAHYAVRVAAASTALVIALAGLGGASAQCSD